MAATTMPAPATATELPALRFLTAGSVDDGKSTLIGRLLLDGQALLADQLGAAEARSAGAPIDLALFTDGLEAEREQGITIDVAYRYFTTPRRKFVIADAPGHEQYTRNMVTAAAGSDAAVVLVDVTKLDFERDGGVALLAQTRRHTLLARLLRVPSIVFAVNKIDAVAAPRRAFEATRAALLDFADAAGIDVAGIVPVSALLGFNVVGRHGDWPWYTGASLLELLESLPVATASPTAPFTLPLQYVARPVDGEPGEHRRVLWGRIAGGELGVGDAVGLFPSGESAVVVELLHAGESVARGRAGQSVGVVLDRQLDASRGDWLGAAGEERLQGVQRFAATLAWLDSESAVVGRKYLLRHGNRWVAARIASIDGRLDVASLQSSPAEALAVNDIGRVTLEVQQPLPLASYAADRIGGALIVVDPSTNRTSGALLVD